MKGKHVKPNLPTLTCHHCGYDMHDRKENDPCPECDTPFDLRPDAYIKPWKLNYPIVCIGIAIFLMPFITIFSLILLVPAFIAHSSLKSVTSEYRIPMWAAQKIRLCYQLMIVCLIEFWGLMLLHTFVPDALNWW